jgi:hypothetical protein
MDSGKVARHCNDDACGGLGDRMIVGIWSVDVRVARRATPSPPSQRRGIDANAS